MDKSPAANIDAALHQRAIQLLAQGAAVIDAIGRSDGTESADALAQLEATSGCASELMVINSRLMPLMTSLQRHGSKYSWWHAFTGEKLEQEIFFDKVKTEIETLAQQGQEIYAGLAKEVHNLTTHYKAMHTEIALLAADIACAKLIISPVFAKERQRAGLEEGDLARLSRRTGNLEAMLTATQLTQAQYKVAIEHAKSIAERYREIRTLLLPLWKQSVGFDLFSRRVNIRTD